MIQLHANIVEKVNLLLANLRYVIETTSKRPPAFKSANRMFARNRKKVVLFVSR